VTAVYRVTIMVVPDEGTDAAEVVHVIENARYPNRCMSPRVVSIETAEVEWSDDHPLNLRDMWRDAFAKLFSENAAANTERARSRGLLVNRSDATSGVPDAPDEG
jgi:hypothetical protein